MDLKQLTELNAVSGHEQLMRRTLLEELKSTGAQVSIDRAGNVVAVKKGTADVPKRVMVAAHMDEVGLIVTSATDEGFLRVAPVGGVDSRVVISKRVTVGDDKVPGIIGAMAIHLQSAADRQHVLGYSDIYVDIGAKDKAEAEQKAPKGTHIAFDTPFVAFGDDRVSAKALDDRVGCWNLLRLLEGEYPCDVIGVFTSEEEVGCRGAKGAAFAQAPDMGLVLEGTAANDLGMVDEAWRCCEQGKGVAMSFMDNASIGNRTLFRQALQAAQEEGIPCQVKQLVSGGNDAGAIQRAREGVPTLVLSVPCRYIHSPSSVVKMSDVDAQLTLTRALLMRM